MFGVSSFAGAPFAALSGNSFAASTNESFALTDALERSCNLYRG